MAEPWIRVHAALIDKPVVTRAVEQLRIKDHAAVGLLVTFWGSVSRHVVGGRIGDVTDAQLEKWARWTGKRGAFAKFIREYHLDPEGRPNEWEDYNGALEDRRERDRERMRAYRERRRATSRERSQATSQATSRATEHATSRERSTNGSRDVQGLRDDTIRRTTTTPPPPRARDETPLPEFDADAPEQTWTPPSEVAESQAEIAGRLPTYTDRAALATLVQQVPSPLTWLAEIRASLDGMAGHPATTPTQCAEAIREFVGNGALKQPNLRSFRRYLEQAATTAEATAARASPLSANGSVEARRASQGGARNDAAIDATLPYLVAKYGE